MPLNEKCNLLCIVDVEQQQQAHPVRRQHAPQIAFNELVDYNTTLPCSDMTEVMR